ncbi:redoxin domain-containing protein [Mesorhizobium sp. M0408]|uniref:redoxin domain-containing protein n=1 Tax=Mesorhizobium sp. M0408 TaxID=2956942 RepID=UPI003336D766
MSAGSHAPAFCLRDQDGVEVSSELLLRSGPILLTFYWGSWCPHAGSTWRLERIRSAVVARGASLVCVSQQTSAENRRARAIAGVTLPILGGIWREGGVSVRQTRRSDPNDMLPVLGQLSRPRAA